MFFSYLPKPVKFKHFIYREYGTSKALKAFAFTKLINVVKFCWFELQKLGNDHTEGTFHVHWIKDMKFDVFRIFFNLFVPNAPFLYPLKTSENSKIFWCFQGEEKGWIGNKWVNTYIIIQNQNAACKSHIYKWVVYTWTFRKAKYQCLRCLWTKYWFHECYGFQASAYEACDRTRMPPQMPSLSETC